MFDYAYGHGIEMHELHRVPKKGQAKGQVETLWGRLMRDGSRSLPIPVRMADTGAPGTRSCTADFKIRVVGRWLQDHGASAEQPARVAIGISTDEYQRASSRRAEPYERPEYPLLHLEWKGGTGLNRNQCAELIRSAGLPVPGKSSCFFCPFHRPAVWRDMARDEPELFAKACQLEDTLNARRGGLGKDRVYLTRFGRPLRELVAGGTQLQLIPDVAWDEDEGYRCGDVCDT